MSRTRPYPPVRPSGAIAKSRRSVSEMRVDGLSTAPLAALLIWRLTVIWVRPGSGHSCGRAIRRSAAMKSGLVSQHPPMTVAPSATQPLATAA